jgi:threonine dehydrogenase-like Zn-dependent dehydrogenase
MAEKGVAQAFEIQRRLRVWRPERAVLGAGTIGLLATLLLRLRGSRSRPSADSRGRT